MPPAGPVRSRFVADAMLGSLARKLRALGIEVSYFKSGEDDELLGLAAEEGRVILTSDRALASSAERRGVGVILVSGRSDGARIRTIAVAARASGIGLVRGDPLCSVCGGGLRSLRRADVRGRVPHSVELRHRLFFECASCSKLYWRGGHWKKLRSLARGLG